MHPALHRSAGPTGPIARVVIAVAMMLASCGVAAAASAGPAGDATARGPAAGSATPATVQVSAHGTVGPTLADATGLDAVLATVLRPSPTPPHAPAPPPPRRHYQPGRPVNVAFLGDSVAYTTAAGLAPLASRYGAGIANEGIMGCGVVTDGPYNYFGTTYPAVLPQCTTWQSTWQAAVVRDQPDVAVIIVGRWELMDRMWQGHWTHVGDPAYDAYLVSLFDKAVAIASSQGAKVALCTQPYYLRGLRPDGGLWPEDDPARVDIMNSLLRQVAAAHPGLVTVVDFGGHLSPGGAMAMSIDGVRIRSDGVHMTPEAGGWLAPWIMPQLVAIGASA